MTGIKVSDYIRPISINDTYSTHLDVFGKGGLHSVASILERNAITQDRRKEGMLAYIADNKILYALLGGLTNANWIKLLDYSTGEILFNIPCKENYTLVGDKNNVVRQSPILIDIRQDIVALRRNLDRFQRLDKLDHNRIWIGDYENEPEERINIGVINLPILGAATFPYPSIIPLPPIAIPNPTFNPFSGFDWLMSGPWLPQIFAGSPNTDNTSSETIISSSLAMTQVKTAQAIKRLDNAGFIVKSRTIDFNWENPAMLLIPEAIKQLYGLNTSYTFTQAQALDELGVGLLKNDQGVLSIATLTNNRFWLGQNVGGTDNIPTETQYLPLANLTNLAQNRLWLGDVNNRPVETQYLPIGNLTNLTSGRVWQGDVNNRPVETQLQLAPTDATYILQTPNVNLPNSQGLSALSILGGILKCNGAGVVSIASGGNVPFVNDYVTPANLAEERTERIGADSAIETALVALEAEVEAEIAALAGVVSLDILGTILGFIGITAGGKAYGDYIRGQTLNIKNTWKATDINDEAHNAVGNFKFRYPSGYSSDDRGHGTLWFDSSGRSSGHRSEPGLRIFSWDSGGDSIGSDDPIAPVHMGIFGYQNKYSWIPVVPNPTPRYKGFIFRSEFNNDKNSDDYRFPTKFGLYDVTRTISTLTHQSWGWDNQDSIFEYDYNNFSFYKNVEHNNHVNFKETVEHNNYVNFKENVDFQKDVKFLTKGSIKIPVGNIGERPNNPEVGMLRYNIEI